MKKIIYILFSFVLLSCTTETLKNEIYGSWGIDTLLYNNKDCLSKLYVNYISFDKKKVILPISGDRCTIKNNFQDGIWKISNLQSKYILTIETENYFFKDQEFDIDFYYNINSKKMIFRLESDSLYLTGSRYERFDLK